MKDAIGGTFSLQIILFFLVVINAYLAFSVNYTKAFRIKNNIIAIIEQQEGYTVSSAIGGEESAETRIFNLMKSANYTINKSDLKCNKMGNGYKTIYDDIEKAGFCLKLHKNADGSGYYTVVTQVNIDIPIVNNILPLSGIFSIKGETKSIYSNKLIPLNELNK